MRMLTPTARIWRLGRGGSLQLDRPRLMFILNVTPDSFSDGGAYPTVASAVDAARRALDEGADILDVGGESTRPGAARVDAETQIARVVPVIEAIRRERGSLGATPISVRCRIQPIRPK
ncbi:dihydropteroate synthase [Leptolyngbya sp. 15MV]|nr:dihydropteroate synthase [Leptolyngbya sp. 15MV]